MALFFCSGEQFLVFLRLAPPKSRNSLVPRSDRRDFYGCASPGKTTKFFIVTPKQDHSLHRYHILSFELFFTLGNTGNRQGKYYSGTAVTVLLYG